MACSCACAVVHACSCPHHPNGTPLSFCSFGSGGNVTPVPGIAASLDPGNSDDRNRHLLPLQHTHCLATGSPHTFPKPFSKGVFFDRCRSRSPSPSHFFSPPFLPSTRTRCHLPRCVKPLEAEGTQQMFLRRSCRAVFVSLAELRTPPNSDPLTISSSAPL